MEEKPKKETPVNPIDKDKITENPHNLPYAHTVGGVVIKPVDQGKVKGRSLKAMAQQTQNQMDQIRQQMEVLAKQAREIQNRVEVSEMIYQAAVGFEPLIGQVYHLYERKDESWLLSLVAPDEWGRSMPYAAFVASVCLLADHTWKIIKKGSIDEDLFDIS